MERVEGFEHIKSKRLPGRKTIFRCTPSVLCRWFSFAHANFSAKIQFHLNQPNKGIIMRMLMNVHLPHAPFNAAVKDGTAGE
jgi:hypothetical protein